MTSSKRDRKFMEIAVEEMLLSQSEHTNKADPMVGVVLVDKSGKELARAHRGNFSAGDHAEFTIFEKLMSDEDPVGGTLYVTLEPCTKRERPKKPCAQRAVEKGIARVMIGILDPNPEICGCGVEYLRKHGVEVDFFDEDLAEEIRIRNKDFIDYMQNSNHKKEASMTKPEKLEAPSHEEERSVPEAHVEDFSREAIREYLKYKRLSYTIPSQDLWTFFRKAKYLVKRQNRDVPTLAGIVLFGRNPEVFLTEHTITSECFSGSPEDGISLDKIVGDGRKNITGPLFYMVKAVVSFYKKHVAKVPQLKGFQRVEEDFEYPVKVIREAIVNALVHRDYTVGAHISFRMFRDRIIIKSPGHLLLPNTIERIRSFDVTPVRRNPRIADAAFNMKLMEREGYGIPMMPSRLKDYGLCPPDFGYDWGYFAVTFYGREKSSPMYRIRPEERSKLKHRQLEILNLIWERGRITSEETTKKFDITRETANQDFRKLLKLGLIERKGTGRATYYILARIY
ncbi:DeoR family transcriptional regulator [Candidatus Bathyarchaeota archaeon]|nr:DeoR family transcriptional regulator [Candidatus Bathyarchaeota archaeon]